MKLSLHLPAALVGDARYIDPGEHKGPPFLMFPCGCIIEQGEDVSADWCASSTCIRHADGEDA